MNKKKSIFILIFLIISKFLFSQDKIPEISNLKSSDILFKEYSYIVADNYKLIAAGQTPDLIIFKYKVTDKDTTLFSLASRCNIPYDTIATLNQLENSSSEIYQKYILLPTAPGLFIKKQKGSNSLEILLQENYFNSTLTNNYLYYTYDKNEFIFIINDRFSPTERAYFLDSDLRLPLDKNSYWISSEFGIRKNPFSGEIKNHKGIDLAAAEGTPVYAIKNGTVAYCIENDKTFGNYIILFHDNGKMTSVYAHLSKIDAEKNKTVKKGDIIGYVGSTGMATGPHLHFEIRKDGIAKDPLSELKLN